MLVLEFCHNVTLNVHPAFFSKKSLRSVPEGLFVSLRYQDSNLGRQNQNL